MTVAVLEREPEPADATAMPGLRLIVLARSACEEGASKAELAREIGPLLGVGANRLHIEVELAQLIRAGLAIEQRSRFSASESGHQRLLSELGIKTLPRSWLELRDSRLVAKSLGLETETASRVKHLGEPDALRAAILTQRYGLKLRGGATPSKLRAALAVVALEQAFGNKIKSELASGSGFNAKASRVLAGQLLRKQRDAGTDNRLIALLAAEAVDSPKIDADALRAALLRRLAAMGAPTVSQPGRAPLQQRTLATPSPAPTVAPAELSPPPRAPAVAVGIARPPAASRPDLPGFVAVVRQVAAQNAEGWPGNRKALISRVFKAIAALHPAWGLTLVELKAMLAECHRTGHLVLTTADLKDKRQLDELRDSAITYKNTVWHLVRVEE